jgi:hypothetical protein
MPTYKPCNYRKQECLEHNFECNWIVGKGCKPRDNAKPPSNENALNYTALPRDVKEIIQSKLNPKNSTALKLTNRENNELIKSIKFSPKDYLEYGLKPYAKQLLKNLTKYEKTFRKDLKMEATPCIGESCGHRSVKKVITSEAVNFDDKKLRNLSALMNKDFDSYKNKLNDSVTKGLKHCKPMNFSTLFPRKPKYEFDEIKTKKELYDYITYQVARDYSKSYHYIVKY